MRRFALVVATTVSAACGSEKPAADAATPATPPAPAPINLAEVAGKWTVRTMAETGDSVLVTTTIDATATTTGWTITLPNREPIPMRVSVSGDSVMTDAGPYESVLRKGVQVSTHGVFRLREGKLVGVTVAHYSAGPDSVRNLRTEGTRAQ